MTIETTKILSPEPGSIALSREDVFSAMHNYQNNGNAFVEEITGSFLNQLDQNSEIKAGYRIMTPVHIEHRSATIKIDSVELNTSRIITKQLQGITHLAVFAVTLGKNFDEWSRAYFRKGDPLSGYIIDTIGSEAAERVADFLEQDIQNHLGTRALNITNRFSPGYCGWSVKEQFDLFSLLPENFCGITLNESALMNPLKSISGIIGIGEGVERNPYPCDFCSRTDCYKRKTSMKE